MSPQVLLDAGEGRGKHARTCEHEGLERPGHPAVAVPEGMNHDEVQVRHGRPHHRRLCVIRLAKLRDEFGHKFGTSRASGAS